MVELSIVIPTYNRAGPLRACLERLCRQSLAAADYEVIVVVDGSTDGTGRLLRTTATPYALRVVDAAHGGPGAARNQGIAVASGQFCLFLDDDVVAEPGLAEAHARVQRETGGVVGLGHLDTVVEAKAGPFARCLAGWIDAKYARLRQVARDPSFADCASGNMSAPRAALLAVGGFATDLPRYEDIELGYRLAQHGLRVVYVLGARGREEIRKGFRHIAADAEGAGAASVLVYRRHPAVLPHLQLGAFVAPRPRVVALRRLLLALRVAPRLLRIADWFVARSAWAPRWYSFLYDYCYWRGVRRATPDRDVWRRLTSGVTILEYHAFGTGEPPSRFVVPVWRFSRQMRWLRLTRRHILSLETYLRYRRAYRLPPPGAVVVTIDDGYADVRTLAYPILRRHRFPATVFLVSDRVGTRNTWDRTGELAGRRLLSWSDLGAMRSGTFEYGGHTRTHPHLLTLPAHAARNEILGGRHNVQRALEVRALAFAYPYGECDVRSRELAEEAGFWGACETVPGQNAPATPLFGLRRTEIPGTMSLVGFSLTLWLGVPFALRSGR